MMKKHLRKHTLITACISLLTLLFSFGVQAQTSTVSGVVTDTSGEGIPGVSVVIKGTSTGTATDLDGNFKIDVPSGSTLVFSFIGMITQEIAVGNQTAINVTMELDVAQLDEVVVVGYGTQKKSELTGAVASIEGDALKKVPVSTVAESLTGRLAGVQITTAEGSPDSEIQIRVRGGASLTQASAPLYIVDGFPVNSISDLTPSDIASIDVLKDASSAAIYGSRGANGVVIITTKTGKSGKVTVNYNTFYASSKIAKTLDVLNPKDYAKWQYEYAVLDANDPNDLSSYEEYFGLYQDIDLYDGLRGNNWQEQVYGRTGSSFSNDLSVRGGSEKFNYSANFARFDTKAIQVGSDYLRNNITLKLNNKPNEKVGLQFSLRYSDTEINGGGANEQNEVSSADSRLKHSVGYSPIPLPGLTSDANETNDQTAGDLVNPLRAVDDNQRVQERKNYNLATGINYKILDNLEFRSDFGLDNFNYNDNRFYGLTTYYVNNTPAAENQGQPAVILRDRKEIRYRNTNTLSYDLKLQDSHKLKILVGQEYLLTQREQLTSVVHGLPTLFKAADAFKLTNQGVPFSVDNNLSADDKLLSFFGRVNYNYLDKYFFEAVYRADGSSRFLGDNAWGYFPSVSAGWQISKEEFMQGTKDWLDFLKLRASFGIAGNNNIPVNQTVQSFQSATTSWINGVDSYWAADNILANPDLKWETTTTKNVGFDFGVFKGRVNGTVDLYDNVTSDLLILFPLEGSGYDAQYQNFGETNNKGLEVSLSVIAIDKKDYGVSFSYNMAFNRNKVTSLGFLQDFGDNTNWASSQIGNDFIIQAGAPSGNMYGYVNDGRYEVSDFDYDAGTQTYTLKEGVPGSDILTPYPGMMKLKDLDGDGEVTIADQQVIGNANPKFTGGFVLNGYAYGFDLTAAFNFSYGNDVYNANKIEFTTANQNNQYRNLITMQADGKRWTYINDAGQLVTDPTELAALNANTTMWSPYMDRYVFSDWAVEDGSFLRLNTLTLGYTLPSAITQKARIERLRFYVTGYNVFILTNYTGFDPEVSTRRRTPLTPGVDYSAYPRSRQVTVGLNLTF